MDKETAKLEIKELVENYKAVEKTIDSKYSEADTKSNFIEPLFEYLGWDVRNKNHQDEVVREKTITRKRPDYRFSINGIPKFFLEAKTLKTNLDDIKLIEQAIDYAWYKGCTWAVLSNFERVMVFNAEWKTGQIIQNLFADIHCNDFLDRFDELWLLSRESFEQGMIDEKAEERGKKYKRVKIDQQLLDDFSIWRDALSKNIMKYNADKNMPEDELDETVQKLLNRLVFIRKAEDAELEDKVLQPALREWERDNGKVLYVRLWEIFRKFNTIYDSELFEGWQTDQVVITNDVLKEVINGLYETKDRYRRYNFAQIDADVLGNVYEQYLGHILKKTKKRTEVKESHAHRKEQGIYYTPTYVVDYIVRNTLGELLKDKKLDVKKIRVLDPACGSGSFLIKAFDILDDHYRKHDKGYEQTQIDTTGQGTTFSKKVDILTKNIFGVDLDKQAVEIARLNLLLKIAEKGERLPLLRQNIKRGNSLIDDEKVAGVNKAFNWKQEFKEVMNEDGFDVIIGNPPYISNVNMNPQEKYFFSKTYVSAFEQYDILVLFIEKGIQLLKENGYLGFIISNKFMVSKYGLKLREFLLNNTRILKIVDVSNLKVFKDAATYPVIIILQKTTNNKKNRIEVAGNINSEGSFISRNYPKIEISQEQFSKPPHAFEIEIGKSDQPILEKMLRGSIPLGDTLDVRKGIETGDNKKFVISQNKVSSLSPNDKKFLVKLIIGRDGVRRYGVKWDGQYLIYDTNRLKGPRKKELFESEKIITSRTVKKLSFGYDTDNMYVTDTIQLLLPKNKDYNIKYLLALINSKLINYFYAKKFKASHMQGGYFRCFKQYLDQIPIKVLSSKSQQPLISLADKMLSLNKHLDEIGDKKTDVRYNIEEETKRTDAEIDELVYKLYGITEEEKKIIEESLK